MKKVTTYDFEVGDTFVGTDFSNRREMYLDGRLDIVCSNLSVFVITDTGSIYDDLVMMGCGENFTISRDHLTSLIDNNYLKHVGVVSL